MQSLAARRWPASGFSDRLPSTPAAAEPQNVLMKRQSSAKNPRAAQRGARGGCEKGNKEEDKAQGVGHCSLTKGGGR